MLRMRFAKQFSMFLVTLFFASSGLATATLAQQIAQLSRTPNGASASDYAPFDYKVSPDGNYVVYRTQRFDPNFYIYSGVTTALYSVPTNGSRAPKLLNLPLPQGTDPYGNPDTGRIRDFEISPDGKYVVYEADQNIYNKFEVLSVPINGGSVRTISNILNNGDDVNNFVISPDGRFVVYQFVQNTYEGQGDVPESLFSVPIRGGAAFELSRTITDCGGFATNVKTLDFSPDGRYALFQYIVTEDNPAKGCDAESRVPRLYSVLVNGGNAKLLTTKFFGDSVMVTKDSSTVVFQADFLEDGFESQQLYSVPITGGNKLLLSQIDENVTGTEDVRQIDIAEPYPVILYGYRRNGNDPYYEPYFRNLALVSTNGVFRRDIPIEKDIINFKISPNNQAIVFKASIEDEVNNTGRTDKLFSVSFRSRGQVQQISKETGDEVLDGYQITPDSSRVVYQESGSRDVYSNSINGTSNAAVRRAEQTMFYVLTSNGQNIVYQSEPQDPSAPGAASSLKISSIIGSVRQTIVPFGVDVSTQDALRKIEVTADNRRAVFVRYVFDNNGPVYDEYYNQVEEIYSVTLPQFSTSQMLSVRASK